MRKNLVIAVLVGFVFGAAATVAQVPAGMFNSTALSSSCIQPPAGQSTLCIAGDKVLLYTNGGPPVQLGVAGAVAGVQKVNGISPDSTGNVTVPIPTKALFGAMSVPLQ
jgi:hypothetical protein